MAQIFIASDLLPHLVEWRYAALFLGLLEQTRSDILLHLFKKGSGFVVAVYCRGFTVKSNFAIQETFKITFALELPTSHFLSNKVHSILRNENHSTG